MENFILLTINKSLGNFAYKDKIISKYSIHLIKTIVLKLKVKLTKEIFNDLSVSRHISQELLKINDSSLGDPLFYKLRSELYEVISICYLNDSFKDYIPNIHLILNQILETNMKSDNMKSSIMRILRDIIGIARPLVKSRVFIVFCKIGYLRIQKLINEYGTQFIGSEDFILCLLDFYEVMCACSMDNLLTHSQTIFYSILIDCFKLVSTLSNLG